MPPKKQAPVQSSNLRAFLTPAAAKPAADATGISSNASDSAKAGDDAEEEAGNVKKAKTATTTDAGSASAAAENDYDDLDSLIPESWRAALSAELAKPYWGKLKAELTARAKQKEQIFPAKRDIFAALAQTPLDKVRVVLIGQDPYHDDGQAEGLCFSVPKSVKKFPPSLKNILKEMGDDVGCGAAPHGHLASWAAQGVLLLNCGLTVKAHAAKSHDKVGWQTFTSAVVAAVAARTGDKPVVWIAWGADAQKKCTFAAGKPGQTIISSVHPSPLSAHRGFFGSKPFSQCNAALAAAGETAIDWKIQ